MAVTWDCSDQFDASSEQDVSFMQSDSYVTFGSGIAKTGSSVHVQLKTLTREAVLLYNTVPPSKPDFVAVELVEGHVRLSMDTGAGVMDMFSDVAVNDGVWHQVHVQLTANSMDVSIDGRANAVRSAVDSGKYLELTGHIYVGGIEPGRHARALSQGVRTANSSLRGCLRSLKVDGRLLGLREARVTRNVNADCVWQYPCSANPCLDGATCSQDGTDSFRCDCPHPPCAKPEFSSANNQVVAAAGGGGESAASAAPGAEPALQVLNLSPVQVRQIAN